MKLWATNEVRSKSKFWYFLRKLKKVKKSNGQILAINEIFEKNPTKIKNFGIWLRYQSRTGYHNMYKEYRDTTLNGAVEQMYTEMASRHRVRFPCIQIIKTATIPAKLCKRESTKQFHNSKIKFPLVFKKGIRASTIDKDNAPTEGTPAHGAYPAIVKWDPPPSDKVDDSKSQPFEGDLELQIPENEEHRSV
ncbi:hypothetical protein OIU78_021932 [Salix suchowensis]|nr:hypothetical protein OIU78_021932 [Salix suchowensis]